MILKVFALVCAAIYAVRAVVSLVSVFTGLGRSVVIMRYRFFAGLTTVISWPVIMVVLTVIYVWMCLFMVVIALRRTKENSEQLFLGLCGGGIILMLVVVVRILLRLLCMALNAFYSPWTWSGSGLLPILGNVIAVGGVFLLLMLMGETPLQCRSVDEIKMEASEVIAALTAALSSLKKNTAQGQCQQPGPQNAGYQPTPKNTGYQPGPQNTVGQPSGYQPSPASPISRTPLKTDRSLVAYILLSLITCGIYGYYFLYTMARDVNTICDGDGKKTGGLMAFILLSFITCGFYALYWYYSLGNRLAANGPRYGMNFQENGTTVLVWYLVGALLCCIGPFVAMNILIKNTNSLCAAYNQAHGLYGA